MILLGLIVILSIVIFVSCTMPGFLHLTGLLKNKNLPVICLILGALFGIGLLFDALNLFSCGCRKNKRN